MFAFLKLATALLSLFSLAGFLAARFILSEFYEYIEHERQEAFSAFVREHWSCPSSWLAALPA
jgi:hypothetical protein